MTAALRRTPLHDAHVALGARLIDFGGWDMPVQYKSGTIKEHKAVREALGLFDVSHMGEAVLRGPRATEAAQRLTSNDVGGAVPGKAVYTLLCRPDGGSARVAGAAPTGDTPWAKVALVPQVLGMAVELSIRENIVDAAAGRPDEARLAGLLERLDVAPFAGRRLGEVSMGQQQRAAVARALVQVPTVLLVDEPTSFQDGRHADGVVAELHRSAAAGAAVLVATHDPIVVAAADRVLDLQAV